MKKKLKEHNGDDIVIISIYGKSSIVSFRDAAHRVLREKWEADRMTDKVCQNDRIIDMAASIIRDEIRLSVHDRTRYPEMDEVENSNMIPDSLRRFLKQVLDPKGKNTDVVNRRRTATTHS